MLLRNACTLRVDLSVATSFLHPSIDPLYPDGDVHYGKEQGIMHCNFNGRKGDH